MKLSKRVLAFLLALVMVVSLCPQTAYAAVGESQSTAEQSQNTDEQTTETKMPEETPADGETAEESEITDVTSVEDKEEVLEEDTGSVKEDTKQSEQAEEEKEQEEGKEEVTEDSETSLQIAEEDVSSARTVNLEYNILTSGETLIGNTKSGNYYFKPEQSGIYYLTVENHEETQLDLNAYYKYFTKDENDVTTESDWYQEWGMTYYQQYGNKFEKILYLSEDEAYRFSVLPYDANNSDFTIKMSEPVEITGITATNPVNSFYDQIDFKGMKLSFEMSDGYTLVSDLEGNRYRQNILALNWIDLAYESTHSCDTDLSIDKIHKIDDTENTDISTLEDGKHTAEAALKIYKNGTVEEESFTFEFNVERNAVDTIEVIHKKQDTYHKDFNESLKAITLHVHYKDGRTPLEIASDTSSEIDQYLSYQDKDGTEQKQLRLKHIWILVQILEKQRFT